MSFPRPLRTLLAALVLLGLAALARAAEPPFVAIPPATWIGPNSAQSTAPLAALVQINLASYPELAGTRLVERITLDAILREQTLALIASSNTLHTSRTLGDAAAPWPEIIAFLQMHPTRVSN